MCLDNKLDSSLGFFFFFFEFGNGGDWNSSSYGLKSSVKLSLGYVYNNLFIKILNDIKKLFVYKGLPLFVLNMELVVKSQSSPL